MALREQLLAVADELRRRKADGEKTVPISEETLAALRDLVARKASPGLGSEATVSEVRVPDASPSPAAAAAEPVGRAAPAMPTERVPEAARADASAARESRPAAAPGRGAFDGDDSPTAKPGLKIAPQLGAGAIPPPQRFTLPEGDKRARWEWLKAHVENHPVCRAHVRPGKKVVLGSGALDAKVFFCGDAPGPEEELEGEPFVGPAGQLLTKMIKAMGLERGQVYIGAIMNWRPEMPTPPGIEQAGNRPPSPEEMAFCLPHLQAQLEIVQPDVIVALGATVAAGLLGAGSFKTLGEIRGRWHTFAGRPVMVTYHPSYLLRNNTNRAKRTVWEDLLQVMERAQLPIGERQRNFFL